MRHLIEYYTYSNVQQYMTVAASVDVMLDSNNFKLLIMEITTRLLSQDDWAIYTSITLFNSKADNHSPHYPNRSAVRRS